MNPDRAVPSLLKLVSRFLVLVVAITPLRALADDEHDIMFVIDNSASMRENDRTYRAPQALIDTLWRLDANTRIGIILFGSDPELVAPLTPIVPANRPALMAATDRVRYSGRRSNPAGAVERALYHLRFDGRATASKWIVLLSDGNVDVGSPRRTRDLQKWLEEDLTQAAIDDGVRIIGIAFTDGADHRLLEHVASRTGGEFVPVFNDRDVTRGFRRVVERIERTPPPREEVFPNGESPTRGAEGEVEAIEPSPPGEVMPQRNREKPRSWWSSALVWVAGLAALAVVGGLGLLLLLRLGHRSVPVGPVRKAILLDRSGVSGRARYDLDGVPVVIGRRPGDPGPDAVRIVIDRKTISRRHAVVVFRDFSYWLADQGTKNGTFVNGERIVGQRKLEHGDVVTIEDFDFEFRIPDAEEEDRTLYRGEDVEETVFKSEELSIPGTPASAQDENEDSGQVAG